MSTYLQHFTARERNRTRIFEAQKASVSLTAPASGWRSFLSFFFTFFGKNTSPALLRRKFFVGALVVVNLVVVGSVMGQKTWDGGGDGVNWDSGDNWNPNGVPGAGDAVTIPNGFSLTVNTAAVCASFTIVEGNAANTVTISGSNSLTVSGAVIINSPGNNGANKIISVGTGELSCASLSMATTNNDNRIIRITISTGTVNVSGNFTMNDLDPDRNQVVFSGAGTLNLGGAISGGTIVASTGTVNYNGGSAQTVTNYAYNNLTLSNAGIKTLGSNITISGNLTISGGTLDLSTFSANRSAAGGTLTVADGSSLFIGGTNTLPSNYSTHSIGATSTIAYTGSNQSVAALNSSQSYGNLVLSGSGIKTFGAARMISGNLSITSTIASLTGTSTAGTLTLDGNGQLSGTHGSFISTATYKNSTYFSSTGVVDVAMSSCASGLWIGVSSSDWNDASNWCSGVIPTAATDVIILPGIFNQPSIGAAGGACRDLFISPGASLTITGSNTLTVSGDWTNNGTFNRNSSTVIFNGTAQTIGGIIATTFTNLTISSAASTTLGINTTITTDLTLTSGIFDAGTFSLTLTGGTGVVQDGATLRIGGAFANGTLTVQNGGTYEHARNGDNIPLATWGATSTCLITGVTTTMPGNNAQNFGHFTWNCPSQTANVVIANTLNIQGDLTVVSTGAGVNTLQLVNDNTGTIGGNYIQSGGSVIITGIDAHGLTISGGFSLSGGTFDDQGDGIPGGALNVAGDFSLTAGGTLDGGALLSVVFNGSGVQTYTSGGDISGIATFTVNSGATLQMAADDTSVSPGAGGGSITFTLSSGATLGITSPDGISSAGATGNVQTFLRTFSSAANYLYNGSAAQNTGDGLPATMTGNLEIDNAAGVALSAAQTINSPGALVLTDGKLTTTTGFLLTLGDGATTSGASAASFVSGPIRKIGDDAFSFPVGKGTTFAPISISAPAVMTDAFQAEYFDSSPADMTLGTGILEISNKEYWDLDRVAGTSSVAVTMVFTGNSMATMPDLSNLRVARFDETLMTPAWVSEGNAATSGSETTSGTITSAVVPNFSFFTLGSSVALNALPIELAAFTATPKGQTVQLDWRTVSELNNAFFDIERSANGRDFERIGKVAGAGTSLSPIDYVFTDILPKNGWNYYRLRQEDFDGQFSYSEVQAVLMGKDGEGTRLLLYPNPAAGELNLKTNGLVAPGDLLEVFDQTGRKVRSFNAFDAFSAPMDVLELPAGTYFVRLQTATGTVQASFVKQ